MDGGSGLQYYRTSIYFGRLDPTGTFRSIVNDGVSVLLSFEYIVLQGLSLLGIALGYRQLWFKFQFPVLEPAACDQA